MKNFLMKDQWSQSRKSKLITAWVGLSLRMFIGVLVFIGSGIFYVEMTENAATLSLYVLCALVPILAVVVVVGDICIRYKLDIKPLRVEKDKDKKKPPFEY